MMQRHYLPPLALASYVRYFWTFDHWPTHSPVEQQAFGPLADGCPGMMFQCADKGQFFDQDQKRLPELFVYGQSVKQVTLHFSGRFSLTGVCFWPHALKAIFGFDAHELTDACLDLTYTADELLERLAMSHCVHQQIDQLTQYLLLQIRQINQPLCPSTGHIVTQLMQAGGNVSLDSVRASVGLSERSLERHFRQQVGIAPKLLATICRFQASLHHLTTHSNRQLTDIAYSTGYADQSHFIRSFKLFTGQTPTQFRHHTPALAVPPALQV